MVDRCPQSICQFVYRATNSLWLCDMRILPRLIATSWVILKVRKLDVMILGESEECKVKNGTMNMAKGIAVGMTVGAALGAAGSKMMSSNKRQMKKAADKTMKAIGGAIDSISGMMGR